MGAGSLAANNYTSSESSNIMLNNGGVVGESNVLRIGAATGTGNQDLAAAYICGIDGVNVGSVAKVVTESGNQLGTAVITAGTGITVTPTANTITIVNSSPASGMTINGNTGSATGNPITITTGASNANGTAKFTGSGSTVTQTFTDGNNNTGLGTSVLSSASLSGQDNTAVGYFALKANTSGGSNCAIGYEALLVNTSGSNNMAFGNGALQANTIGAGNTGIGTDALALTVGGGNNTAIGFEVGFHLTSGSYNLLIGNTAGINYTSSESSNIMLNHGGVVSESNVLRIGAATGTGNQDLAAAYICGINGVNVGSVAKVVTMASDQLGTATITAGSGITVTPTANTITIAMSGSTAGFTWNDVTTPTQTMVANNGYVADNAAQVTMTLPATAAFGTMIRVTGGLSGLSTGSWKIAQPAGVQIHYGNQNTTRGVTGSLTSTNQYDAIEMVCVVANTDWTVSSGTQGNITVA